MGYFRGSWKKYKVNRNVWFAWFKKFKPIFITQLKFDGLKDKKLFLVNNELKLFAEINDYFLIPLDEMLDMQVNDFYDEIHTTPQGSQRIANMIFPILLNFFEKN